MSLYSMGTRYDDPSLFPTVEGKQISLGYGLGIPEGFQEPPKK